MSSITDLLGRSLLHRLLSVAAISLSVAFITSSHAQSITTPCMENGSPCQVPGPAGIGNLMLPLPFGITYNSMSATKTAGETRPDGPFGLGTSGPVGFLTISGDEITHTDASGAQSRYTFSPLNRRYVSQQTTAGDLSSITSVNGGYEMSLADGSTISFTEKQGDNLFFFRTLKDLDGHTLLSAQYYRGIPGKIWTITGPNGLETYFEWDFHFHRYPLIKRIKDPFGVWATLSYGTSNCTECLQSIDYDGSFFSFAYDSKAYLTGFQIVKTGASDGGIDVHTTTKFTYTEGLISLIEDTSKSDGTGAMTQYSYTNDSVTIVSGSGGSPTGAATTTYRTINGNPIPTKLETLAANLTDKTRHWEVDIDSFGRTTRYIDALGKVVSYAYSSNDAPYPTTATYPDGTVVSTKLDSNNLYRAIEETTTAPDGKAIITTFSWTGAKLTNTSTTVDGQQVSSTEIATTSTLRTSTSTATYRYTYDKGRLATVIGPGGTQSFTHSNGALTKASLNGNDTTFKSTYKSDGSTELVTSGGGLSSINTTTYRGDKTLSIGTSDANHIQTYSSTSTGSPLNRSGSSSTTIISPPGFSPKQKNHSSSWTWRSTAPGKSTTTGSIR